MTDSMAYPDPRIQSTIAYPYSPTTIDHTQCSASPTTIPRGECYSPGVSHQSVPKFDTSIKEPSDHYTPDWGLHIPSTSRSSTQSRARLSNNISQSCNCFPSYSLLRQSMGSPHTYSFFLPVDNHRGSEDHYQTNSVTTDPFQYQFSESDGGFDTASLSLDSQCTPLPQPELCPSISGPITSPQSLTSKSQYLIGSALEPEKSDEVFPRVLNDMYDRVEHAFRVLSICLRDFATVHPESYSAEVDAYLSLLNEYSYQLFLRGYRPKTFTKRDHEYLVPLYSSIYSRHHRMDIGESGFIRRFVRHAIKRLRSDIRSIEVHELQDAEKAKKHGYSDDYDFDPTENRIIVDRELVDLEKKFRSAIGPFWETDSVLYWQSLPTQEARFSVKSKSVIDVINGEVGYLPFIKMLRCCVLGVEAMFKNVKSMVRLGARDEVAKKQIITTHMEDLKSSIFRFLCSIFPENLSNDLVNYWIEGKQKHPTRPIFLQDLIPALRTRKHMIMKDIREIATENLEKIDQRWNNPDTILTYRIKRRQAIEDCAAIERELEDFEKRLLCVDREWNSQRLLSFLESGVEVSDQWSLKDLTENDADALRESLPDMKSLGQEILSSLREIVPELQSVNQAALLSSILRCMAIHHHKGQDSSSGVASTDTPSVSQTFPNDVRSISSRYNAKERIWRVTCTDEVEETGTPHPATTESVSQSSAFQSEQFDNINTPNSTPSPASQYSTRSDSPTLGHKLSYRQIVGINPTIAGPSSSSANTMGREPKDIKNPELLHAGAHLARTWEDIQRNQQLKALSIYPKDNLTSTSRSRMEDWGRKRGHSLMEHEVIRQRLNIKGRQGQHFLKNDIPERDSNLDGFSQLYVPHSAQNTSLVDGGETCGGDRDGKHKGKGKKKAVELYAESEVNDNGHISDDEHFFVV